MKGELDDRLIERYVSGNETDEDRIAIEEWAGLSRDNAAFLADLKKISQDIDMLSAMKRIDSMSALKEVKRKLGLEHRQRHGKAGIVLGKILTVWKNVAAVIIVPVLLLSVYRMSDRDHGQSVGWTEVASPYGVTSSFQLPDSTVVQLNSHSRLTFPTAFEGKERIVELDGEAFFRVKADKSRPFIVRCSDIGVRATGTEFNVLKHGNGNVTASLCNGSIDMVKAFDGRWESLVSLVPGQTAFYYSSADEVLWTDRNIEKYIAWIDGKVVFSEDSLEAVLEMLERAYGVRFIMKAKDYGKYLYTGTFVKPSLDRILKYIEMTTPIEFHRNVLGTEETIEVWDRN